MRSSKDGPTEHMRDWDLVLGDFQGEAADSLDEFVLRSETSSWRLRILQNLYRQRLLDHSA